MAGLENQVLVAKNVNFDHLSNPPHDGIITSDGQLLIGSTADPNIAIVANTLTEGSGISITNGPGSITLAVDGSKVGKTITGNTGGALPPTAGNWNIVTANSTVKFVGSGSTLTQDFSPTNLALGSNLSSVTTAINNVIVGQFAGSAITSGNSNNGLGINTLLSCTQGSFNTALGGTTLQNLTTTNANTAVGYGAGTNLVTGVGNVLVGNSAGSSYTTSESSNICIGRNVTGTVGESGVTRIGAAQTACYIDGIDGVNVGSVATVVTEASDRLGTATITAGAGITVTPSANAITIAGSTGGFTWNNVTSTSASMVKQNGYQANNAGLVTLSLPATASSTFGDTIQIAGLGAGGWTISQAAGQQIQFGSSGTTVGVTGSISSTNRYDAVELVYSSTAGLWLARYAVGNLTVA